MGVRGLWSYMRRERANFHPVELRNTVIILDGSNIINKLYIESSLYTQYNGEHFELDIIIEEFMLNLRKCNLEPIFIFDGLHEVSKLETVLHRNTDRLIRLSHLQEDSTRGSARDGTSGEFRVEMLPLLSYMTFLRTLERCGARYVVVDYEADQVAAAMAIYLGVPLVSNDSDFFILGPYWAEKGSELKFIPTESCDFRSPHASHRGFYISAEQYVATESFIFRRLSLVQLPLFAVLCGNDYVPPGYFNSHLPGSEPQQPYVRPTGAAASASANAARNAIKFRRLIDWLSGFGNDIVEPVERILSKFPKSERSRASRYIYTALASYHVPFEELAPYLSFLFGESVPPPKVSQSPPVLTDLSVEDYGRKALQALAIGKPSPQYLSVWNSRLLHAFRRGHILTTPCDALFAYGIVCPCVVEDYQSREPFHLCSLPLRCLLVGLLLDNYPPNAYRLPGILQHSNRLSYKEYRREGCTALNCKYVHFDRVTLQGYASGFAFLQQHLFLPERPPIIPMWLHGMACTLFLWARFDARPESENLVTSSVALAVSVCAVAIQMRLLQSGAATSVRARRTLVQQLLSIRNNGVGGGRKETLRFAYLHNIAQMQSVLLYLSGLIDLLNVLMPERAGCEMELLSPQVMFPSGCLAHHIACRLASVRATDRLAEVTDHWLPELLGPVETQFLLQVKSMFTGLIRFVDSYKAAMPPAKFRAQRRDTHKKESQPRVSVQPSSPSRSTDHRIGLRQTRAAKRANLEATVEQTMRDIGLSD